VSHELDHTSLAGSIFRLVRSNQLQGARVVRTHESGWGLREVLVRDSNWHPETAIEVKDALAESASNIDRVGI
jgi:hypothetical protein